MSHFNTSRSQEFLHADMLHASSYSDMYRDALQQGNSDEDPVHDAENSEQNHTSESMGSQLAEQPSLEKTQNLFYTKGLEEIENLQLLDLSPLATWRLSSHKQGHGLQQLRDDSPETYWQSDGSMENSVEHLSNSDSAQLNHPHTIMLQFSKKVSLERISMFTNYQLDESYTPLKIKIMAGSSNWDLTEVCVVNFEKPMGWSHIIFKGVRGDGLLKCFVVKIIILANHQDGKDSHIRAMRCYRKKSNVSSTASLFPDFRLSDNRSSLPIGLSNESGILLNNQDVSCQFHSCAGFSTSPKNAVYEADEENQEKETACDPVTSQILRNVSDVLWFNLGFDSIELRSISSVR